MATELTKAVENLIELVEVYVDRGTRYARAEKVAHRAARSGLDAAAVNAAIPGWFDEFKQSRQAVLDSVIPAAEALEAAGLDTHKVLMLRNAVAGPGGSATIQDLWPTLKAELQRLAMTGPATDGAKSATPGQRRDKATPTKRSWTQPELNDAIQAEITKYAEAITSARNGSEAALQNIHKLFRRNPLADRLGGESARKMVSKSPVWISLADEFELPRKTNKTATKRPKKIGYVIAGETAAEAAGDTTEANVIRRETVALLDKAIANVRNPDREERKIYREALVAVKDQLTRGAIDDDAARKIVELHQSQQQDDHSDRALSAL